MAFAAADLLVAAGSVVSEAASEASNPATVRIPPATLPVAATEDTTRNADVSLDKSPA